MLLEGDWPADGYVVARGLFSTDRANALRAVCERCREQWMVSNPESPAGQPGGPRPAGAPSPSAAELQTARSMRHLNHPAYFEAGAQDPDFKLLMEAIADPAVTELATAVLGCAPLFRSTTLFFNPQSGSREGDWHRDSQFTVPVEEQERTFLSELLAGGVIERSAGIQMQVALVANDDVELVPGSHRRWDTAEEYRVRMSEEGAHSTESISTALRVALQPGDAVLFNSFGFHRGRYYTSIPRRTLMLTFTPSDMPFFDCTYTHQCQLIMDNHNSITLAPTTTCHFLFSDCVHANFNVGACMHSSDFSDQPWMLEPDHLSSLNPAAKGFFSRFLDAYGRQIGGDDHSSDGDNGSDGDGGDFEEEAWQAHVRPHHVTGRKYTPQMIQMQRNLERLGIRSAMVSTLASSSGSSGSKL
jgi:hypothetical protein